MSAPARPSSGPPATIALPGPKATEALGQALADLVGPGDVLLLEGPIGAGKTHLARALIQTLQSRHDAPEDVPSPSFTLVQTYRAGPLEIWHADLYRLTGPEEVIELGLEEAFGTALCLVEWPDRLGEALPPGAVHLALSTPPDAPDTREISLSGGARADAIGAGLLRRLASRSPVAGGAP